MRAEVGREAERSAQPVMLGGTSPLSPSCQHKASARPAGSRLEGPPRGCPCPPPTQTPHTTHTLVQTHHTSRWSRAGPSSLFVELLPLPSAQRRPSTYTRSACALCAPPGAGGMPPGPRRGWGSWSRQLGAGAWARGRVMISS